MNNLVMVNNQKPVVSVIMTSYNRGHYIGQAIDSILSQECSFPIEIIIGDDYSTDNSRELLLSYQTKYPSIIVLNLQEGNQGFCRNWASTCKLAKGKYIAFLDDDDYYCDNHRIQNMVDFFDNNQEYGFIYTNYYNLYVDHNTQTLANKKDSQTQGKERMMAIYKGYEMPCFGTCMIRKELLDKYVPLDEYVSLNFPIQDWPTEVLIAPHCKFKYFETPSYVYRQYSGSMSKPKEYEQIIKKYGGEKIMYKRISELVNIPFNERGWDCYVNHLLMSMAYDRGEYKKAKYYGKLRGGRSIKVLCTKSEKTFHLFIKLRHFKNKILLCLHQLKD